MQGRFGLWGLTFNEVVFLLAPGLLYARVFGLSWKNYFPLAVPAWRDFLLVLLLTALVIAPIELLIHLQENFWPLPKSVQTFYEGLVARNNWYDGLIQFFALAFVPAVCEEFFFRGLLYRMMEPRFGTVKTILLTALFFALAHMNPWYLLYYFLLGVYFGWLRSWKGNLVLCILAHFINNLYSLYG